MLLVPLRRYLLPRLFSAPHLADLDADELLRAEPLDSEQLRLFGKPVLAQQQLAALQEPPSAGAAAPGGEEKEEEVEEDAGEALERQFVGQQVVHELTQAQLARREQTLRLGQELPQ
jgi:hypothetical protein